MQRWSANTLSPGVREGLQQGCVCRQAMSAAGRLPCLPAPRLGKAVTRSRKGGDGGMRKQVQFETLLPESCGQVGGRFLPRLLSLFFSNEMHIGPFPGPR